MGGEQWGPTEQHILESFHGEIMGKIILMGENTHHFLRSFHGKRMGQRNFLGSFHGKRQGKTGENDGTHDDKNHGALEGIYEIYIGGFNMLIGK